MSHPEQAYLDLLQATLDHGIKNVDRGTGAVSYSQFGTQSRYDLSQGFPLLTTKKVYWKGILTELFWFLKGMNNIKYLEDSKVGIWSDYPYKMYNKAAQKGEVDELTLKEFVLKIRESQEFANKWGILKNIYGDMWRHWPTRDGGSVDQLQWVLDELKADPDARNLIVNSWNPEYLYTMAKPEDALRFPICHNMFQVSQKEGKIYLQIYIRSNDLFLGAPFNIGCYALLNHIIAHLSGYQPGYLIHTIGDAHIYDNHIEQAREQLTREPRPLPKISISAEATTLENILPEHILLENYDPHPALRGEMTVAGGLYEE
jgi:thymidylate synthase